MCGIIGSLGLPDTFDVLLRGLELLQNRGYDSFGIATMASDTGLHVSKTVSTGAQDFDRFGTSYHDLHKDTPIGIGHTRWATHGTKTRENAHPHTDALEEIALVHNGIIENYRSLKSFLVEEGISFRSETDSEVIVQLMGWYKEKCSPPILKDPVAFLNRVIHPTISRLEGTWAIAMIYRHTPETLYLSKKGSPLVIGLSESFAMISSESLPLAGLFRECKSLVDGMTLSLTREKDAGIRIDDSEGHLGIIAPIQTPPVINQSCHPYPFWTMKEIYEQPESLSRCLNYGGRLRDDDQYVKLGGLDSIAERLVGCTNLLFVGCGSSLYAAQIGSCILKRFRCMETVSVYDASELTPWDIPRKPDTRVVYVMLSQSGETRDVCRAVKRIRRHAPSSPILGIVNVVGSLLSNLTDAGIYLNAGPEIAVASTKSFTSQIVAVILLSLWFFQKQRPEVEPPFPSTGLKDLPEIVKTLLHHSPLPEQARRLASQLDTCHRLFLLGRECLTHTASEAALKLKEICYVHAEGYAAGSLKHGPFALMDEDTVVVLLIDENQPEKMINTAEEILSRNIRVLVVVSEGVEIEISEKERYWNVITLPIPPLTTHVYGLHSVYFILFFQLLAYETARHRGIHPDYPRHLAKVVTVDG